MVENNSFSDVLQSVTRPLAKAEHEKTLQALQSELEYHRKRDGNTTYLEKAVSFVYDGGTTESMHKLELAYNNEQEHPNVLSRQEVIKLVQQDQQGMHGQSNNEAIAVGTTAAALAFFGGGKGRLAASALIASIIVHPNDSLAQQSVEAASGLGLGLFASTYMTKGIGMRLGAGLAIAYPVSAHVTRFQWPSLWPNQGIGRAPDPEKIYSTEVSQKAYSPYLNLQPISTPEWEKFDFLKTV